MIFYQKCPGKGDPECDHFSCLLFSGRQMRVKILTVRVFELASGSNTDKIIIIFIIILMSKQYGIIVIKFYRVCSIRYSLFIKFFPCQKMKLSDL